MRKKKNHIAGIAIVFLGFIIATSNVSADTTLTKGKIANVSLRDDGLVRVDFKFDDSFETTGFNCGMQSVYVFDGTTPVGKNWYAMALWAKLSNMHMFARGKGQCNLGNYGMEQLKSFGTMSTLD